MLNLACLCGRVRVEIRKIPDYVNECNCTLCSKSGARWAYFHPSEVSVDGPTGAWCREDKDEPAAELHFCANCGATTHYVLTPGAVAKFGNVVMGVNLRLADEGELPEIELRYPDGRAWPGHGEFGYVRDAPRIGRNTPAA
jgi:hypothetical protein